MRRKIGNSSSKYDFAPDQLDRDIQRKGEVSELAYQEAKALIMDFLKKKYAYSENESMSAQAHWNVLIATLRDIKDEFDF